VAAHACNPSYLGGSPGQAKSSQDPIPANKKLRVLSHACHPSYARSVNGIVVQASADINKRPYWKNKSKKGCGHGSSGKTPA
jgi:hypothetical protein